MTFHRCDECCHVSLRFSHGKHREFCIRRADMRNGKANTSRACSAERDSIPEPHRITPKCGPAGIHWEARG